MYGRGGCCIAQYAGDAYDMSNVDRIMSRFRPIAPKPAAGMTTSGGYSSENGEAYRKGGCRAKRKYVREKTNSNKRCNRRRKASPEKRNTVVTLPLLPETPDRKDSPVRVSTVTKQEMKSVSAPMWLNFENCESNGKMEPTAYWYFEKKTDLAVQKPLRVAYSYVTIQCVTETWMDRNGLGSTNEKRKLNLGKDTCPGFISDCFGRVTWTNGAYRKMVGQSVEGDGGGGGGGGGGDEEVIITVWLVMTEEVAVTINRLQSYTAFTCRVRVHSTCGKESSLLTVPCDVWRMDSGGFAWRLDVKAALSLGR